MQFDPNANFSNDFSFEKSREVIREMKGKQSGIIVLNKPKTEKEGVRKDDGSDNEDESEVIKHVLGDVRVSFIVVVSLCFA